MKSWDLEETLCVGSFVSLKYCVCTKFSKSGCSGVYLVEWMAVLLVLSLICQCYSHIFSEKLFRCQVLGLSQDAVAQANMCRQKAFATHQHTKRTEALLSSFPAICQRQIWHCPLPCTHSQNVTEALPELGTELLAWALSL